VRFAQSRPVKTWAQHVGGTEGSWISVQRYCKCGGHHSVHQWKHSSRTLASSPGGHSPAGVVFEYKVCEQRHDIVVHMPVKVQAGQDRVDRPIACSCGPLGVLGLPPGRSPFTRLLDHGLSLPPDMFERVLFCLGHCLAGHQKDRFSIGNGTTRRERRPPEV